MFDDLALNPPVCVCALLFPPASVSTRRVPLKKKHKNVRPPPNKTVIAVVKRTRALKSVIIIASYSTAKGMSAKVCAPAWSENGKRDSQRSSFIHVNAELHVVPCERASGENTFLIRILDGTSFFFFTSSLIYRLSIFLLLLLVKMKEHIIPFFPPRAHKLLHWILFTFTTNNLLEHKFITQICYMCITFKMAGADNFFPHHIWHGI